MIVPGNKGRNEVKEKKDIMAHATDILEPIKQFDRVEFTVKEKAGKGVRAKNIQKIKE